MTELLAELGRKLGERWLSLLVLPGLLFVGVLGIAFVLGWEHAVDVPWLVDELDTWTGASAPSGATAGLLIVAGLLASVGAGLAAEAVGSALGRWWLVEHWPHWPAPVRLVARRLVRARASRWDAAYATYRMGVRHAARAQGLADAGVVAAPRIDLAQLYHPVERVSRDRPVRPTWAGDRINGVATALRKRYHLDIPTVWPMLSLTIPAETSKAIDAARERYQRAARLAGWALLYAPVAVVWWPGLIIVAVAAAAAHSRGRASVEEFCLLLEAAVVLHTPQLVRALDIPHTGVLDRRAGAALTAHLQGRDVDA